MTVEQMKQKKQQLGYSCEQLSELSGISLEIIQNIFSGNEKEWSLDVLQQLEKIFKENVIDSNTISASLVCESKMEYGVSKKSRECTLEDYYQLPDERRAELIDGVIYDMSAPTIIHQKISLEISVRLHAFISQKKGACMVFSAPVDVQLDCDEKTIYADYLYSNKSVEKDLMPRLVQSDFTDEIKEMLLYVCSVHEELLKSSFDEILKRYSSFDEYFEKEYAIDKEVKENLIKKYCHEK